jgi:Domain of unknown function (DUF4390)
MRRRFFCALMTAVALGLIGEPGLRAAAELIRVTPLVRDGHVLVSFELSGGFTDEVRETIQSGLQTTFSYDLELRRGVPVWVDRTLAISTVSASVQFDNLTRRHQLSRSVDGRVEEAKVTEREDDVQRWLTSVERLPLFRTADLEPNAEYYVRVRVRTRPKATWSLWPWGTGIWGHARFTFLQ